MPAEPFDAFVARTGPSLVRLGYALTGDRGRGEDLAQEALARCWSRWRRMSFPEHPEAYARRTAVNLYLSARRLRRETERVGLVPDTAVPDDADGRAERDALWRALATLSKPQRAVLVLRYYDDLPDERIADLLGCRPATVRSHAARGLARLRALPALDGLEGAGR